MKFRLYFSLFMMSAAGLTAEMTREQRLSDFVQLASLYAKQYGPYEWKRDVMKFDLYDLQPWLERIDAARSDLEFLDLCAQYIAALKDSHTFFSIPSSFSASLGFAVDIYEDKVLIDGITRRLLPAEEYPFQIGDELVAVDGVTAEEWIARLEKYSRTGGNPRGSRRVAALRIVSRPQSVMPRAHEIGETASVQVRRAGGDLETYEIRWQKTGVPLLEVGPVPSPKGGPRTTLGGEAIRFPPETPAYLLPLLSLGHTGLLNTDELGVIGVGALSPLFALPTGFQQRLGRSAADDFFSGTFAAEGLRIGLIRIPRMSPNAPLPASWAQFENEVAFMEQNTDGLIVDVMRNPGGFVIHTNELLRRLIPYPFETIGFEVRATAARVANIALQLEALKASNAPDWAIAGMEAVLRDIRQAYSENRGRTGPIPLDAQTLTMLPAADRDGRPRAYSKPIVVLIDDFSISGGDAFPATFQDAGRGLLVGTRTGGAGGSNGAFLGTNYTEATAGVTFSLMSRPKPVATLDFGVTRYVENVGVRPDIELDIMTRDNLLQNGRPFFGTVTAIMAEQIRKGR